MAHSLHASQAQEARNKAVVERYFHEVLDRRKFDLMPELIVPDVVLHRPGFDVMGLNAADRSAGSRPVRSRPRSRVSC
jgi:hypothetical protein